MKFGKTGIVHRAPIIEFSKAYWGDVLQINLEAVFFLSQVAAHQLALQGNGKIINIALMLSLQDGILVSSYVAAKSGMPGISNYMQGAVVPVDVGCAGYV